MSRRPRWDTDAGITDRDVAALRWLGQQYAARSDVLRSYSAGCHRLPRVEGQLGETTLRDVLARWEDRGLVVRDRLLGHLWVAPTVKALRLVGLDVQAWSFVIPQLAHVHAKTSVGGRAFPSAHRHGLSSLDVKLAPTSRSSRRID